MNYKEAIEEEDRMEEEANLHKYRKKPVVVEAFQITLDNWYNQLEWPSWLITRYDPMDLIAYDSFLFWGTSELGRVPKIKTPEGILDLPFGYYVVKGVKGELYPCKPDIFEAIYEKV